MTDPVFDLNFLGGSDSSSSTGLGMQSPLDQFELAASGLDALGCTGTSMFAPLSTGTGGQGGGVLVTQPSSSSFSHLTSGLQANSLAQPTTPATQSLTRTSSLSDYSKHFSTEYSSAGQNHHSSETSTSTTTPPTTANTHQAVAQQDLPAKDNVSCTEQSVQEVKSEPSAPTAMTSQADVPSEDAPVIDIVINNVVCSFSTRCHLNLKKIAREGMHVVYKPENGMVSMKLRKPYTTANIWSSGKITATGATSEVEAKIAARRYCRILQKIGFNVRFANYRVVNVLGTCSLPFGIRITHFSRDHKECSYEPELHPGATYVLKDPKATLKIFSTGSITVTAPRVENVQMAIQHIFPLVYQYRMESTGISEQEVANPQMYLLAGNNTRQSSYKRKRKKAGASGQPPRKVHYYMVDSDGEMWSDTTDEELNSEEEDLLEEEEEDY